MQKYHNKGSNSISKFIEHQLQQKRTFSIETDDLPF